MKPLSSVLVVLLSLILVTASTPVKAEEVDGVLYCNIRFNSPRASLEEHGSFSVRGNSDVFWANVECTHPENIAGEYEGGARFTRFAWDRHVNVVVRPDEAARIIKARDRCILKAHLALSNPEKYEFELTFHDADFNLNPQRGLDYVRVTAGAFSCNLKLLMYRNN